MVSNALRFLFTTGPFWILFLTGIGVIELLDRVLFKSGMAFWYVCLFALIFIAIQRRNLVSHGLKYQVRWFKFALAAAAIIMPFLPAVYESFLVSSGNFPGVFFGVDSPYHSSQVFSLLQS